MPLSTIERVLFLRQVDLFSEVNSEELSAVAQVCQEVEIAAEEQFITQGDMGDCLYIIVAGEARVTIEGVGDVLYRITQDIIGEMAILSSNPRSAHCIATTDITALKIEQEPFWDLMAEKPALALGVIKVLAQRLDEAAKNLQRIGGNESKDAV